MHALLAHAYHLALNPAWRPPATAGAVAGLLRLCGLSRRPRGAALTACFAVLAGWLVQDMATLAWPMPPIARLPGLAVFVLADSLLRGGAEKSRPVLLVIISALAAWWLRGAPLTGAAVINCMPVFLGLLAAFPLARRLARDDIGWATLAACITLACALIITGASPHWARAALVPGIGALVLLGVPGAVAALAGMIVVAAAAALVASDRGRLVPVDAACLVPLLVWAVLPRLIRMLQPPAPAKRRTAKKRNAPTPPARSRSRPRR